MFPVKYSQKFLNKQLLILICVCYPVLGSCTLMQKIVDMVPLPELHLETVEFAGIDLNSVSLRFLIEVENPYPFAIPHAGFDLGLSAEGKHFTSLKSEFKKGIPAGKSMPVTLNAKIPFKSLLALFENSNLEKEVFNLGIKGDFDVYLPTDDLPDIVKKKINNKEQQQQARKIQNRYFDKYSFDVDLKKEIPAILPEVKVSNFQIEKPSLSDISISAGSKSGKVSSYLSRLLGHGSFPGSASSNGLAGIDINLKTSFDLELSNRSSAMLNLLGADYELHLAGQQMFRGQAQDVKQVASKSYARIETSFPLRSISYALSRAIHSGKAPVRIKGSTNLKVPGWDQKLPLKFNFDQQQSLSW